MIGNAEVFCEVMCVGVRERRNRLGLCKGGEAGEVRICRG